MKNQSVKNNIDWISVFIYVALVVMGWLNIYSSSLSLEGGGAFDFGQIYGKQLLFIMFTIPLIFTILPCLFVAVMGPAVINIRGNLG